MMIVPIFTKDSLCGDCIHKMERGCMEFGVWRNPTDYEAFCVISGEKMYRKYVFECTHYEVLYTNREVSEEENLG